MANNHYSFSSALENTSSTPFNQGNYLSRPPTSATSYADSNYSYHTNNPLLPSPITSSNSSILQHTQTNSYYSTNDQPSNNNNNKSLGYPSMHSQQQQQYYDSKPPSSYPKRPSYYSSPSSSDMYGQASGHHRTSSFGTSINSSADRDSIATYHSGHENTHVTSRAMHHHHQAMNNEMNRIRGGHQNYDESNYYEPPSILHSGNTSHYDYDPPIPMGISPHHHRQQYHSSQSHYRHSQFGGYQSMPSSYPEQRATSAMHRNRRSNLQSSYVNNRNKAQKPPSKPIYCEICRISCMSEQTYKEHIDGQKHKKREQQSTKTSTEKGIKCELCDIVCLTAESYDAHIIGSKHQKVVRLHKQLGKPIPDAPSPETIIRLKNEMQAQKKAMDQNIEEKAKMDTSEDNDNSIKSSSTNLQNMTTTGVTTNVNTQPVSPSSHPVNLSSSFDSAERDIVNQKSIGSDKGAVITPSDHIVGEDFCVLIPDSTTKVPRFECRICRCSFNQADRHSHLSGKRHKSTYYNVKGFKMELNYEKTSIADKTESKVVDEHKSDNDPTLQSKTCQLISDVESEQKVVITINERPPSLLSLYTADNKRTNVINKSQKGVSYFVRGTPIMETIEDRLIMKKHDMIFPNSTEIKAMHDIVMNIESTLRDISDVMIKTETNITVSEETSAVNRSEDNLVNSENLTTSTFGNDINNKSTISTESDESDIKLLQDIRRIGAIAEGLMLNGDKQAELALLCAEEPTVSLLQGVESNIKERLTGDNYDIQCDSEEGVITVSHDNAEVKIYLTSAIMESQCNSNNNCPAGNINRETCLNALIKLRRYEWFKKNAMVLEPFLVVMRVIRDHCRRDSVWSTLKLWPMEVLIYNAINSTDIGLGPAKAFRRVLEVIASGVLLPDGPGIKDPCEKEPCNAFDYLDIQTAEDITASAQYMLRQVVFRQLHKILDIDPIPPQKRGQARNDKRKLRAINKVQDNIPVKKNRLENPETPIDREIVESM